MLWAAWVAGLLVLCGNISINSNAIQDCEFTREFDWNQPPQLDDILRPFETSPRFQTSHSNIPEVTTTPASPSYHQTFKSPTRRNDQTSFLRSWEDHSQHHLYTNVEAPEEFWPDMGNQNLIGPQDFLWNHCDGTLEQHHQSSLPSNPAEKFEELTNYSPDTMKWIESCEIEAFMSSTLSTIDQLNDLQTNKQCHFSSCSDEPSFKHKMISETNPNDEPSNKIAKLIGKPIGLKNTLGKQPFSKSISQNDPLNQEPFEFQKQLLSEVEIPLKMQSIPLLDKRNEMMFHESNPSYLDIIHTNHILTQQKLTSSIVQTPLKKLIFDASVFRIENQSEADKSLIQKIISTVDDKGKPLVMYESQPDKAIAKFISLRSAKEPRPRIKTSDRKKEIIEKKYKRSNSRFDLMKKSCEIFWSQRDLWMDFYQGRTGIRFQDLDFRPHGKCKIEDVMDQFIVFLFYVDMITSIIVKSDQIKSHQDFQEIHNNVDTLKNAATQFQPILESLKQEPILKSENLSPLLNKRRNYQVARTCKSRTVKMIWVILEKWIFIENKANLQRILFGLHSKKFSVPYFNDIFCYSITHFNQQISNNHS
ncbi:hypothetical protein PGT21_018236 [Puccinia graminis f. sp. tritici]|uniref:Uncharacterized protein n=1 Tax=Puccinia graminis f. sp. tritici TaxID=56615 RepID=A0A5B0LVU2_PUCGR|nr:hypothetical protein PGT21_018236 [Puccinia graminis f. sp. tritici]KAA1093423.1 hypothetical protein PGTUg99_011638 [Puccinia graminis f. sp. tritici]